MLLNKRGILYICIGAFVLWLIIYFAFSYFHCKIGVNITKSLPYSFFLYEKKQKEQKIKRGDIVLFNLPVSVPHEYGFKKGDLFGKRVVGVSGDTVTQKIDGETCTTFINGLCVAVAVKQDKFGNSLPTFRFIGIIPEGSLFVATTHPLGFDSRYFGFIPAREVTGLVLKAF